MKILITGITGFVGPHLARYINSRDEGHEIHGTIQNRSDLGELRRLPFLVKLHECELKDSVNVNKVIAEVKPDIIFHLAAQSFVQSSWISPADTLINNIIPELNLFEACRKFAPECIVQIAGSSEEYGQPVFTPITEDHDLKPLSPYGVSKVAQEKLGFQYYKSYGIRAVLTRAFNHTGPGRDTRFAEATFAQQVASGKKELLVGNLEAIRDYTDVRDMVRAYWLAANAGVYGEPFNICSGKGYKMSEVLDMLIMIAGKDADLTIRQDPERMRPSDLPVLIGSCEKFTKLTGWQPEIKFEKTLGDLYESFANS